MSCKILIIVAHQDDEVLGCGATIAKHTNNDDIVQVVFLADGTLIYSGIKSNVKYILENQLFAEVDVENSKWNTKGRNTIISIAKKEAGGEYWPRLTHTDKKDQSIRVSYIFSNSTRLIGKNGSMKMMMRKREKLVEWAEWEEEWEEGWEISGILIK